MDPLELILPLPLKTPFYKDIFLGGLNPASFQLMLLLQLD